MPKQKIFFPNSPSSKQRHDLKYQKMNRQKTGKQILHTKLNKNGKSLRDMRDRRIC